MLIEANPRLTPGMVKMLLQYSAQPIAGADAKALARAVRARGRIDPVLVPNARALTGVLPDVLHDGDLLILMGAGDIGAVAQELATKGFEGAAKA